VSTVATPTSPDLFDTELRQVHLAAPLEHVPSLAASGTAHGLHGALGCDRADGALDRRATRPRGRGDDKVLVAVLTDGHENASREPRSARSRRPISCCKARPNWTFVFLSGARDRRGRAISRNCLQSGARDAGAPTPPRREGMHALERRHGSGAQQRR
jgi:hypothetical protein